MTKDPPSAELTMAVRQATGMSVLEACEFARTTDPALLKRILEQRVPRPDKMPFLPEELREKIFEASASQKSGAFLVDPIEFDPLLGPVIREVMETVRKEDAELPESQRGGVLWLTVQQRLEELGIRWHTPAEMNPGTIFN
ncbi:hypothetical protein [Luteolibacter luteus]|uniref:Uncharacterized protein n=1 Tax=Luteolibacter luteus TaxID=2728835 RepID=A0A858RK55_9BACT|nr:hypothetical protein [Luteolibacter luteus]QJE97676.1 hypothetical protein HHL09_18450 [Luteolibacter luteus]